MGPAGRAILAAAVGACALLGAAPAAAPTPAARAVERANEVRALVGLAPVTLDPALSRGCEQHVRYLVLNGMGDGMGGANPHAEDKARPGYTPEGDRAARSSDISFGDDDPVEALEGFLSTLYHRVLLFDSKLARVGIATSPDPRICLIDVLGGRDPAGPPWDKPIAYPAAGQKGVPAAYEGQERPEPTPGFGRHRGYPVTVTFPRGVRIQGAAATLSPAAEGAGPLPAFFSSPERPANPARPDNSATIGLFAEEPLESGRTYRAAFRATVQGRPWSLAWEFTTEGPPVAAPEPAPPGEEKPPPKKKRKGRKPAKAPVPDGDAVR